ncbi:MULTISPECIES: hypothetical protein [unclassified Mycobacterium]|uniref:hypothetical protein n=1 Tax=unclassified Mycobacterium TaxID=2642494 RepID=UPI0029C81AD1|nr:MULTISPECIES: hypothetical protein [unclassified Mycobacterium]
MRRWIAIAWHATFLVLGAVLYFFFVLPRWFELTGAWTPALGRPMRVVDGLLIGLAALPVVFTLLRTRKPEFGTPQLALSLRLWSIVLHVLAGVLIVGGAVAEIWLSLDSAGQWLFGIYGAAAAMAVLGALGFYLAFVAELPPPPPKPIKLKSKTTRRGRGKSEDEDDVATEAEESDDSAAEPLESPQEPDSVAEDEPSTEADTETKSESEADTETKSESDDESEGKLRNRRPGGKTASRFRRKSGGVALDE